MVPLLLKCTLHHRGREVPVRILRRRGFLFQFSWFTFCDNPCCIPSHNNIATRVHQYQTTKAISTTIATEDIDADEMAESSGEGDDLEDLIKELLDGISNPDQHAPSGIGKLLKRQSQETWDRLFPKDREATPQLAKELLPAACKTGNMEGLMWLMFFGADPSTKGRSGSPLEVASFHGNAEIVEKLIHWQPDVVERIDDVKMCLAKAGEGGHLDLVKFWYGHVINICNAAQPWSNFDRIIQEENIAFYLFTDGQYAFIPRRPNHDQKHLSRKVIQEVREYMPFILKLWISEGDTGIDNEKLTANWCNRYLDVFEKSWLQYPHNHDNYTNISSIDLSHNSLQTIPRLLLWGMPCLEFLDVSYNELVSLPKHEQSDAEQSNLVTLKVSNNSLTVIPSDLFLLPKLQCLLLARNQLDLLEEGEEELSTWRCASLHELNIFHNELTRIPQNISAASGLKILNLSNNSITDMVPSWNCPLETLNLSRNQLTDVPDIHEHWSQSLKVLYLSHNKLGKIPLTICKLRVLENLNLSNTMISELPAPEEWKTCNLTKLDLSSNLLDSNLNVEKRTFSFLRDNRDVISKDLEFPAVFGKSLKVLNLSNNNMREFPRSVCDLRELEYLILKGNPDVSCLPDTLSHLRCLTNMKLDPNQIKQPKQIAEILHKEKDSTVMTSEMKHCLQERLHETCSYVKVVIIGPPRSGKTELLCSLASCSRPEKDAVVNVTEKTFHFRLQDTSDGTKVSLTTLILWDLKGSDEMRWDLRGSDDMLGIHQALLTPRTIYLLVWNVNADKDDIRGGLAKLKPYLFNIQARAPGCPIIAVATHVDQLRNKAKKVTTESRQILEQVFPDANMKFVGVDARPQGVHSDLKTLLKKCASTLTYMQRTPSGLIERTLIDRKVPKLFKAIKEHLSGNFLDGQEQNSFTKSSMLTEEDLVSCIKRFDDRSIETSEEFDEVVDFLQDCGTLIQVRDHTFGLTNLYFLDPVWFCDILVKMSRFVNEDSSNASRWKVGESWFRQLCTESGFDEDRHQEYQHILVWCEEAMSINKGRLLLNGRNEDHNRECSHIIPSAIIGGQIHVEHFRQIARENVLVRSYRMAYIPPGFLRRLMTRLFLCIEHPSSNQCSTPLRDTQTSMTQEGLNVHHSGGHIKVEPMGFQNHDGSEDSGIRITLRGNGGSFAPLCFIVEHVENLIGEWYPGLLQIRRSGSPSVICYVPCPTCEADREHGENREEIDGEFGGCHVFKLNELMQAVLNGNNDMGCPRCSNALPLKTLVPEAYLTDLSVENIEEVELESQTGVYEGLFGEVVAAKYDGQPVVVNVFSRSEANKVTQENAIQTVARLRYAVKMVTKIGSPSIVKLIGVFSSVERLGYVTERAPFGDLASYLQTEYDKNRSNFIREEIVDKTVLTRALTFKIALQVAATITSLHDSGVVHAGLDTKNVLLFSKDPKDVVNIKLACASILHEFNACYVTRDVCRSVFSAPEIRKGLPVNEKIDWFSFAMLLYHIISGTLPFGEKSLIDMIARVANGSRPHFTYDNLYTMRPQFPQMESLMGLCWQQNPDSRPSGKEVLAVMRDLSFLCLRNDILVESEPTAVWYTNATPQMQEENDQTGHVYVWHTDGHVVDYSMVGGKKIIKEAHKKDNMQVTCGVVFHGFHAIGTSDKTIEVFGLSHDVFAHQKQIKVPSEPSVLRYQAKTKPQVCDHSREENTSGLQHGLLYVGMCDGVVMIFRHQLQNGVIEPMIELTKFKPLTLNVDFKPCRCITLVRERGQIWMSCGTNIRVLESDGLLDPTVIEVSPTDFVEGLCYSDDSIWCFVANSSSVARYNAATFLLEDTFDCGNVLQRNGSFLRTTSVDVRPDHRDSSTDNVVSTARVRSIITVKDTLWIGRQYEQEDILVVQIGNNNRHGYKHGEVLAVLSDDVMFGRARGPTNQLLDVGFNCVAACQEIRPETNFFYHRLLIWENWGSDEINEAKDLAITIPLH